MKIFHLCETLKGGIATHLNSLLRHQREDYRDADIVVLCPAHHAEFVDVVGVTVIPFVHRGRNLRGIVSLWREWAGLIRQHQPDVLHLHSSFAGLIGRTIPHRARTIYCAHGWAFTTNASPLKKRIYSALERLLSRRTDAIIVISQSEMEAAAAAGIDPRKCAVVYNGVEDRPPAIDVRPAEGPIRALFVGRFDEQKGYDVLIDAFRLLGDQPMHLHLVGEAVQGQGKLPDLPSNVTTQGWITPSELGAVIAGSDVLVVPSRWEGFGLVAIEAMREGRPVVAHKVGGLPEIVADGETGLLFSPLNAPTLAAALARLNTRQLRAMGAAARLRFDALFTDRTMYAATDAIYQRILPSLGLHRSQEVAGSEPSPGFPQLRPLSEAHGEPAQARSA
jgi:glycosyltransferase involved in cell wall biosynthesis